jgi:hypothetical protein
MQPVKNGRADATASESGAGSPSEPQPSDMQALQQAGYLAQLTDAAEGMGEAGEQSGGQPRACRSHEAAASTAASEGDHEALAAAGEAA